MIPLNAYMEFDHVIEIKPGGKVVERPDIYAPCVYDGELDSEGWTLLDGFSGQYGYSGPMMHSSEFIGGGLEAHILATPGIYVALVGYNLDDSEPDEWAVAYRETW